MNVFLNEIRLLVVLFFLLSGSVAQAGGACKDISNPKISRFTSIFEDMQKFQKENLEISEYSSLRTLFFRLETLAKLYAKADKKKSRNTFSKIQVEVKSWEDKIGALMLRYDLWKANGSKEDSFYVEYQKVLSAVGADWKSSAWLSGDAQKKLVKDLRELGRKDFSEDLKEVKSLIANRIESVDSKIRADLHEKILQPIYDYEALEYGLHEMRRSLRWIAMYFQAHRDLFFVKTPDLTRLNAEQMLLYEKFKDVSFAKLGEETEGKIGISAIAFYELSYFIGKIGDIKDEGEKEYYLTDKFKKRKSSGELEVQSHRIYEDFLKSNFLDKLLQDLRGK